MCCYYDTDEVCCMRRVQTVWLSSPVFGRLPGTTYIKVIGGDYSWVKIKVVDEKYLLSIILLTFSLNFIFYYNSIRVRAMTIQVYINYSEVTSLTSFCFRMLLLGFYQRILKLQVVQLCLISSSGMALSLQIAVSQICQFSIFLWMLFRFQLINIIYKLLFNWKKLF